MKYFGNFASSEDEQKTFFDLLYHDKRGGQIIRLIKRENAMSSYSTCDIEQLAYTGTDGSVYVSLNAFRGSRRTTDHLYCRTAMYIDLDCHEYTSVAELDRAKKKTAKVLERAFEAGVLAVPTMITSTGRGYGIYYVLRKSIASTDAASKSLKLLVKVYDALMDRYAQILEREPGTLAVDSKVRDASRVVRMPGTFNVASSSMCHLISVNHASDGTPRYYDLRPLISQSGLVIENGRSEKPGKIVNLGAKLYPFLKMRVKRLHMLQQIRGARCVDSCREMLCFVMYSALAQIYEHDEAVKALHEYNDDFVRPLPKEELAHIVKETDEHVVPDGKYAGCKGYYPYSDYTIIKTLDITADEVRQIGFGRSWQRQKAKEDNREKRAARDKSIVSAITAGTMTYAQIAADHGVSTRTVERIARAHDVGRHRDAKAKGAELVTGQVSVRTVTTASVEAGPDKICTESFGVGASALFLERFLSALRSSASALYAELLTRMIASARALGDSVADEALHFLQQTCGDFAALPYLDLLGVVSAATTQLAIWLTDCERHKKSTCKKKKVAVQNICTDLRFAIIDDAEEYQRRLSLGVLERCT